MRLTPLQIQTIKSSINRVLDAPSQVWLFGSRADDDKVGGDIDLLVEADAVIANRAEALCRL
ncbi:MAG: nucleotidyltransferase domain-containing protein [Gallionellaceae bacterium]